MELKPCPFCGSLRVSLEKDCCGKYDSYNYIKCYNCGAQGGNLFISPELGISYKIDEVKKFVSKKWNERHN